MDEQTKRLFLASGLCLAVLLIWTRFFMPPPPPPADGDQTTTAASRQPATADASATTTTRDSRDSSDNGPATLIGPNTYAEGSMDAAPVTVFLGSDVPDDDNPFLLQVDVTSLQAAVRKITLTQHRARVAKKGEKTPPAYELLRPVADPVAEVTHHSFAVQALNLLDAQKEVDLRELNWRMGDVRRDAGVDGNAHQVALSATVFDNGLPIIELTRTYTLPPKSRQLLVDWQAQSLSPKALKFAIVEDGPMGFEQADSRFDKPRVMTALVDEVGDIDLSTAYMRSEVFKAEDRRVRFIEGDEHILWSAVGNKYFTCIVYPVPEKPELGHAKYLDRVVAKSQLPIAETEGDLTFEQWIVPPGGLAARQTFKAGFEIYCGAKRDKVFEALPAAMARNYALVKAPDGSACTFDALAALMRWLLAKVHGFLGNYGIAIIVLVIIVRTILHPVTKKSQLNMLKMQKNSKRLQPKIKALQKQYKNDKQKLQEETMKLYREEGINPASTVLGCLPMLLQTPVWIALYTTLNTDVSIRHQPFFGYIRDLSSPDVLVDFAGSFTIPLLGSLMGPISALHLLPILMSIVMIMQMKLSQKMAAANKEKEEAEKKANQTEELAESEEENPMAEAMEKNQKMMIYIMPVFGLMFYNMPSGLCLYILSNSVLGMGELHLIRKQLREMEERGELMPKKKQRDPNKPKGKLATFLEEAQKRAEEARKAQGGGGGISAKHMPGKQKRKKKPRF